MISSPSQSSVGRLLSGKAVTNSSKVHRRAGCRFGATLGLAAITCMNQLLNGPAVNTMDTPAHLEVQARFMPLLRSLADFQEARCYNHVAPTGA